MLSDDASDTSNSHSSDNSYTDPPSPTEPFDAFAGYYRTAGASGTRRMNERIARPRMRFPGEEEVVNDVANGADGLFDSEDASEVDVQGLPVKGRRPKAVRAARKGQCLNQRHRQNSSTPLIRSKHSGRVMDQSRDIAGGLESNSDGGLHLGQSHTSQMKFVSPPTSGGQLRYPKLRSGKDLPEPIFVVRPRFLSDVKEKGKHADILSGSGHSRGVPKNGHEGTKIPPRLVKAAKRNKVPKYQAPSVGDDLRDAEFDEDSGLLIRDI